MKLCVHCEIEKQESDFHKNKYKKDGLQPFCKDCNILINKNQYQNKKKLFRYRAGLQREKTAEIIDGIKRERGCYFCPENEPCCLDFHHIDEKTKIKAVANYVSGKSLVKALEEIKNGAVGTITVNLNSQGI